MSRLENYFKKERRKRLLILIFFIIAAFYLFFNYGIPLLINSVLLVKNLQQPKNSTTNNTNEKNNNFIYLLEIDDLPPATNSSRIIITGTTFNLTKLIFYLNGKKVKEKNLKNDGSFFQIIDNLKENENNKIFIKGLNKENKPVKQSKIYSVFFKKNKPKIEIIEPEDNKKVNQSTVIIKGTTDKETIVKINDYPVVVNPLGQFEYEITLNEGENKIKIQAEDIAGNQELKTLTIFYEKED